MQEFISQNGFGAFIWSSFASAFILMIAEILILRRQRKQQIARIKRQQRLSRR